VGGGGGKYCQKSELKNKKIENYVNFLRFSIARSDGKIESKKLPDFYASLPMCSQNYSQV
jgi:hypothetical protein